MQDVYVMAGEEVHMFCEVSAYPKAEITWSFQPCGDLTLWPTCRKERVQNVSELSRSKYFCFISTNHKSFDFWNGVAKN